MSEARSGEFKVTLDYQEPGEREGNRKKRTDRERRRDLQRKNRTNGGHRGEKIIKNNEDSGLERWLSG